MFSVVGKNNHLYVGSLNGIYLLDIADPENPIGLDHEYLWGPVNDMEILDDSLFAAVENGIAIVDITIDQNMNAINIVRYHDYLYGWTTAVRLIENNSALIASNLDGVTLFSIISTDDGYDLQEVGIIISSEEQVESMEIRNNLLYTLDYAGNFKIHDVSNINQPVEIASENFPYCGFSHMKATEDSVFVACENLTYKVEFNGATVTSTVITADTIDLKDAYIFNGIAYQPDTTNVRMSK